MQAVEVAEKPKGLYQRAYVKLLAVALAIRAQLVLRGAPKAFVRNVDAFINMGTITGVLGAIIVGIVLLLVVAALAPTFITAVADLVSAIENNTFNNTTADGLRTVFGLIIAIGGLFALVAYAFIAYRRRGR